MVIKACIPRIYMNMVTHLHPRNQRQIRRVLVASFCWIIRHIPRRFSEMLYLCQQYRFDDQTTISACYWPLNVVCLPYRKLTLHGLSMDSKLFLEWKDYTLYEYILISWPEWAEPLVAHFDCSSMLFSSSVIITPYTNQVEGCSIPGRFGWMWG